MVRNQVRGPLASLQPEEAEEPGEGVHQLLVVEFDTFHHGYQRTVDTLARLPDVIEFCWAASEHLDRLKPALRAVFAVQSVSDAHVRGVAILDVSGTVKIATEDQLVGTNLPFPGPALGRRLPLY